MQIKRIVVGLAPGKESDAAVRRALQLARLFEAKIDVVHGVGIEPLHRGAAEATRWAAHVAEAESRAKELARGRLEVLIDDPTWAETPLDDFLHVRPEDGARALLDHAGEHGADLLVLGAHRHRRIFDFGGTARTVLARSTAPVWIQPSAALECVRVLAPVDLSHSSGLVLEAARDVSARLGVPVAVLHVFVPPTFAYDAETGAAVGPTFVVDEVRDEERTALADLVAGFDWKGVRVETVLAEGDPSDEILSRAGDGDLVVMGTHGRTGLARAVLGSCAYRVLKHREGATLVVPQEERHFLEAAKKESASGRG